MTKKMYDDYIKALKRREKLLVTVLVIFIALFVGVTIFAFSEFEVSYEKQEEYVYENTQTQTAESDADITQTQTYVQPSQDKKDNTVYIICGAVVTCVLIIVIGLVIYGTNKSKSNKKGDS